MIDVITIALLIAISCPLIIVYHCCAPPCVQNPVLECGNPLAPDCLCDNALCFEGINQFCPVLTTTTKTSTSTITNTTTMATLIHAHDATGFIVSSVYKYKFIFVNCY